MKASIYVAAIAAGFSAALTPLAGGQETERLKRRASDAADAVKDSTERAVNVAAESAREAWAKTKAFFSNDPKTYRSGAEKKLDELGAEIADLQVRGGTERAYFQTQLKALEEQRQFARRQLTGLPPDEVQKGRDGSRKAVDQTLERLEDHLDIARRELNDFAPRR